MQACGVVFLTTEGNVPQGKGGHLPSVTCKGKDGASWNFLIARGNEITEHLFYYSSWKCHLFPPGDENALRFYAGMKGTPSCGPCINPGTSLPLPPAG